MKGNLRVLELQILAIAVLMASCLSGSSHAQASAVFAGKFTLTTQVQWHNTILQPGNYTVTIPSVGGTTFAEVTDGKARPVARFMSGINEGKASAGNALLIKEKDGQFHVYSLKLGSQGGVLVYDRALARKAAMEARVAQTVPVTVAKR
jgi:hypothetical protein